MKKIIALGVFAGVTAAAFGAAPATSPVTSAPNWYNVEVIVFRSLDPNAGNGETWPADPGTPDWAAAVALSPPDSVGPPVPYEALSPVGEQLDPAWNRLRRARGYEPLLHVTWTQPIADRASASAVRLGVPPTAAPGTATGQVAAAATAGAAVAAPATPTPAWGTAKLSTTGPYLHFDLDLVLQGPPARTVAPAAGTINTTVLAPPGTTSAVPPAVQFYRLREDMRVNGGKVAYFDHPLFGAIVLVTPVRH